MLIDRSLYYEGRIGTMKDRLRKYRDRPAIEQGEQVRIIRLTFSDDGYGLLPRTLVRTESGTERWLEPTRVDWQGEPLEIVDNSR
jgi:hypothetical protein